MKFNENKKVLLRERKRHTARRVVNIPSVVLTGYPPQQGTPPPWLDLAGYPPQLPHGILGNVEKHYGIWVPPRRCGQTNKVNLLPSRRTTYADGNNTLITLHLESQRRKANQVLLACANNTSKMSSDRMPCMINWQRLKLTSVSNSKSIYWLKLPKF